MEEIIERIKDCNLIKQGLDAKLQVAEFVTTYPYTKFNNNNPSNQYYNLYNEPIIFDIFTNQILTGVLDTDGTYKIDITYPLIRTALLPLSVSQLIFNKIDGLAVSGNYISLPPGNYQMEIDLNVLFQTLLLANSTVTPNYNIQPYSIFSTPITNPLPSFIFQTNIILDLVDDTDTTIITSPSNYNSGIGNFLNGGIESNLSFFRINKYYFYFSLSKQTNLIPRLTLNSQKLITNLTTTTTIPYTYKLGVLESYNIYIEKQ